MNAPNNLFAKHMQRIQSAIALQKTDHVPVVLAGDSFSARHLGVKLSEFANNPEVSCDTMINSLTSLGEFDGTEIVLMNPRLMGMAMLCDIKIPGRELPENTLWQFDERGLISVEDYDTIIADGIDVIVEDVLINRMQDKNLIADLVPTFEYMPTAVGKWIDKGIVPFCPVSIGPPFEDLSMMRGMNNFYQDLYRYPDKVDEVLRIRCEATKKMVQEQIRATKAPGVFLGLTRSSGQFISLKNFERFAWPYIKELVETIVAEGAYAYLHADSNWERNLKYLLDLPKGRCVISSDSATDIYKMKEVLDGHMCLMGDIPASLLTLGTPDEVYRHCRKLITEIGPTGYILSQSCNIPPEAKPENVKAMLAAAQE